MQNNPEWKEEIELIASIIRKANLESTTKWGAEMFVYNGRNVLSYGGFKNHFTIWFNNGVFLSDPYKVLVNAQEGKTKALRQWRFTSRDQVDEKKILEYIYEAIEIEKKGLKIAPDRSSKPPVSELLTEELEKDLELKAAFNQLTAGRQKEYVLYLNEAKQEATKLKRFDKIKPMILCGMGLNDKYK